MDWDRLPEWVQTTGYFVIPLGFITLSVVVSMIVPGIWLVGLTVIILATPLIALYVRRILIRSNEADNDSRYQARKNRFVKTRNTFGGVLFAAVFLIWASGNSTLADFAKAHLDRYSYSIETRIDREGDEYEYVIFQFGNPFYNFILNWFTWLLTIVTTLGLLIVYTAFENNIRVLKMQACDNEEFTT